MITPPLRFGKLQHWAQERGFTLGHKQQAGYPLAWRDPAAQRRFLTVPELADIEPTIHDLIARREVVGADAWYLRWTIRDNVRAWEPWSPFERWVHIEVIEGMRERGSRRHGYETGYDPTIYASPEEALVQAPLLPLETGAACVVCAILVPLSGRRINVRLPHVTDDQIDEYTLLCLRHYASYEAPGMPGRVSASRIREGEWDWVEERLGASIGAYGDVVTASLERLQAQGILTRDAERGGAAYVTEPRPKCWWACWKHYCRLGSDTPHSLVARIYEAPVGGDPPTWLHYSTPPDGWEGPFAEEDQAYDRVTAYAARSGIKINGIHNEGLRRSRRNRQHTADLW